MRSLGDSGDHREPDRSKPLDRLASWGLAPCRMDADTKHTLAKMPIVLICLFLCFVDTSDEGPALAVVGWGWAHYLHSLVLLDLMLKNRTLSKVYYSFLTAWVAWNVAPIIGEMQAPTEIKVPFFLLGLAPYLLVTWVVWKKVKRGTQRQICEA